FQTLFGSAYPEIKITDCDEAMAAGATDTSSQTQSTSAPDTAQASNEPNTEVASPGISNKAVEEEELSRKLGSAGDDAAVRDAHKNLNREDQRLGDEFIRILGLIRNDAAVRDAYKNLNRKNQRLGDEFIRILGRMGKPKDLDRIITLVRINNTNRPPTAQKAKSLNQLIRGREIV